MLGIIIDIKCHIASFDPEVWYRLYRYDPEFARFAISAAGCKQYKKLFNVSHNTPLGIEWRMFGRLHREDDENGESQPAVWWTEWGYERMEYFKNGLQHRDNDAFGIARPAVIESTGYRAYYINNKLHRGTENGVLQPAIYWANGIVSYFINGKHIHQ